MPPAASPSPPLVVLVARSADDPALLATLAALPRGLPLALLVLCERPAADASAEALARAARRPLALEVATLAPETSALHLIAGAEGVAAGGAGSDAGGSDGAWIDDALEHLARHRGEEVLAAVVSGDGADGADGLRALAETGARTLVLEADEPPSALARSAAAVAAHRAVGTPAALARELAGLVEEPAAASRVSEEAVRRRLDEICEHVRLATGHEFRHYKPETLVRRVARRLQLVRAESLDGYLERLGSDQAEAEALFRELLVRVTAFFRDPDAFEALAETALAALAAGEGDGPLRVWVPGCATGEEAYTLAILLADRLERARVRREVSVFGTDVDPAAIAIARKGVYGAHVARDVLAAKGGAELLERWFHRRGGRLEVDAAVRESCVFSVHDLTRDSPFSRLDLVSCRNVLLYLGSHLQKKLVPTFHYALRTGGFLFLGPSEGIGTNGELFRAVDARHRIHRAKAAPRDARPVPIASFGAASAVPPVRRASTPDVELAPLCRRIVLEEFSPRWVAVNEDLDVVHASTGVGRYLEVTAGDFQRNVVSMARDGLRVGVRGALQDARREKRRAERPDLSVRTDEGRVRVHLTVQPMPALGESELYLLLFRETGEALRAAAEHGAPSEAEALVSQLESELRSTRGDLERAVQDLESANEELKSSNEELRSMNEELRAANEELETSREEVQLSNEALLHERADLENLLRASDVATIFLDESHRIVRFTPAARAIYRLRSGDVGRPLEEVTHRVTDMPALPAEPPAEREVELVATGEGELYERRVVAYADPKGRSHGLVVHFVDVTDLERSRRGLVASEERFRALSEAIPDIVFEAGPGLEWVHASPRWSEITGFDLEAALGLGWLDAVHPEDYRLAQDALEQARREAHELDLECRVATARGGWRWFVVRARPRRSADGVLAGWIGTWTDVHELRESENELRGMADALPAVVAQIDADERYRFVNGAWVRHFGIPAREALGRTVREVVGEKAYAHAEPHVRAVLRGEPQAYEAALEREGVERLLDVTYVPRRDLDGVVTGFYVLTHDVTESRRRERETAEREERLRLLLASTAEGIYGLDLGGRCTFANRACAVMLGYADPDELVGRRTHELFHHTRPDGRAFPVDECQVYRSFRTGEEVHVEDDLLWRADGTSFRAEVWSWPIRLEGEVVGSVVTFLDVTERRAAEAALRESEARFRRALTDAAIPILMHAEDGEVLGVSEGLVQASGHPRETLRTFSDWLERAHGDRAAELAALVRAHFADRTPLRALPLEVRTAAGEPRRWEVDAPAPQRRADGRLYSVFAAHDVTERERAAEALRDADRRKNDFLAVLGHELRNPLAAVRNGLRLFEHEKVTPEQREWALGMIDAQVTQLSSLLDDLLDLTRISRGKVRLQTKRVVVAPLVRSAVESVRNLFEDRGHRVTLDLDADLAVRADPTRLEQVAVNLLTNAAKYTPDGGHVEVTARRERGRARLSVADDGIGLAREDVERIFTSFAQVGDKAGAEGGLGIGLSLVRELVELHGGQVGAESPGPGKGSTFWVLLPLDETAPSPAPADGAAPRAVDAWKGRSVLVVDDNEDAALALELLLGENGCRVSVALTGGDGLARARELAPDVVLLDLGLPDTSGYEVARALREAGAMPPLLVALTGYGHEDAQRRTREAGFHAHVVKPVDLDLLGRLVAECFAGEAEGGS